MTLPRAERSLRQMAAEASEGLSETLVEWREQSEARRQDEQARRRALLEALDRQQLAEAGIRDIEAAAECSCSCHPRAADPTFHSGSPCSCQKTAEERAADREALLAELAELSQKIDAGAHSRSDAKILEAAAELGVELEQHGGFAPYQILGSVDGTRFYLRERHGHWQLRIPDEAAGDLADPVGTDNGTLVIAEGDERGLYDENDPTRPLHIAVQQVRLHRRRRTCPHSGRRAFCPDCGEAAYGGHTAPNEAGGDL